MTASGALLGHYDRAWGCPLLRAKAEVTRTQGFEVRVLTQLRRRALIFPARDLFL
jgi:hypothetical protein